MDQQNSKDTQSINWWIASLAMSVVLCAIFAGYVFDIKEDLKNSKIRAEIMEQRMDVLSSQMDNLRRRTMLQQALIIPSEKEVPPHDAVAPMPEGQQVGTAPVPQAVPSPPGVTSAPPMPQIMRGSSHGHE